MTKVFLTGATGFVGSAVARLLTSKGFEVLALSKKNNDRKNIQGLPVSVIEGDLKNPDTYKDALKGCDCLFHVAADYRIWVPNPKEMHEVNVLGTKNLMLNALGAGIKKIVYTSSVATLGINKDGTSSDEKTPVSFSDMVGVYKQSKYLAEAEVTRLIQHYGLPAVIVNPSTPIGPNDIRPTPTGKIIVDAVNGKIPAFVDTGLNIAHVDDVAMGHLLALEKGKIGERYILGGTNLALSDILTIIANIAGKKPPTTKLPHKLLYPVAIVMEQIARVTGKTPMLSRDALRMSQKKMYFSSAKAEKELGYKSRPAKDAIADAIAWFKANWYC